MNHTIAEWLPVAPEIFLLTAICIVLVVDLFVSDEQRVISFHMSMASLVATALVLLVSAPQGEAQVMNSHYVADGMSLLVKLAMIAATALVFFYSRPYLQQRGIFKGEYFVLGMFGLLGMMIMTSANGFLVLYLGLELLALSLYAMVAFDRDDNNACEAAMKYFVLGSLASGMLLYGISMLYGATGGGLLFSEVHSAVETMKGDQEHLLLVFGLVFVVVGLAFKLGAVPFHMWLPDVYQGAPSAVTLYIGSIPKLAAFAMAIRILVDGLQPLLVDWQGMLMILAVLSMGLGNIVAIAQTNLKRMLAYSTISHVGFITLGLLSGTAEGYGAAMFYTLIYVLMSTGAFGMILLMSRKGFEADKIEDYKGLNERHPWMAFSVLLLMFSMAGVPPTVGFFAKLTVLSSVIEIGHVWLAMVAVFFSIIGAFYYLRIVKVMYFDKPRDGEETLVVDSGRSVALSLNSLSTLLIVPFVSGVISWCIAAFQ